jgi:hypothetical protein
MVNSDELIVKQNLLLLLLLSLSSSSPLCRVSTHIPDTNHVPRGYIVAAIVFVFYGASVSSSCVGSVVLLR